MNSADAARLATLRLRAERAQRQKALIGQATLMSLAFAGADLAPYGQALRVRAAAGDDANAWMDLSILLQLVDQRDLALSAQAEALALATHYHLPAPSGEARIRLLALMAPGDFSTNAPLDFLLEDSDVALDVLYVGLDLPLPASLPEHDLLFVAIGEAERTLPLLEALQAVVASWPRPVLNPPQRIALSGRDRAPELLKGLPGLCMPITVRLGRSALAAATEATLTSLFGGEAFPLIARPLDAHAGKGLAKIEDSAGIAAYLRQAPAEDYYLSLFVDYRSADGFYRKYRLVLIAGRPYAVHMAISTHWMIHYLNAGMTESEAKRGEEARFMAEFDSGFGRRHSQALAGIAERFGLDYLVIDCAETGDGRLLVFEVDTGAVVHLMDPEEIYPYKPEQMRKVFTAFRELLAARLS